MEVQEIETGGEVGELEAVETQIESKPDPDADLPEKYRGKSVKDIAKMHQEAEKLLNRHAQEVGEVRKLADELIKSQLKPKHVEAPIAEVDFFENPQEAIRRAVETNPSVLEARQMAGQVKQNQAVQQLAAKHPDFVDVVGNGEFQDWIKASKVRTALFAQADSYDVDAADELLSTFKELKALKTQKVTEVDKTSRNQALRAASVDTGGSGETSKKVYRRADLINLRIRDPGKYEAMADEILAAYSEGRVK